MAIPPLMFVLLFNGFFITLAGVQDWMIWAIYISPMFWGLQEMASLLFSDGVPPTSPDYPRSGQFVIDQCTPRPLAVPRTRRQACRVRTAATSPVPPYPFPASPNCPAAGSSGPSPSLPLTPFSHVTADGFRTDMMGVALAVLLGEFVFLRVVQAICLKRLNNPEK
jgi:hypothetical protein